MASAGLRAELTCSICLNIYTDPVTLPCEHSFCRTCIGKALDMQEVSGAYRCPECRAKFHERLTLEKNRKLSNIVENIRSTHSEQVAVGIFCTYCINSPVPAAKTCLLCEASLCENHVRVHSKSAEHVLSEPTTSLENRKCSVHKEILRYYCCEDAACICVSCSLAGEHRGHQVETLNEASEKKNKKLRSILKKLTSQRAETENRVQNLHKLKRQVQEKSAGLTERVTYLIRDIREQLEALEKRVLREISRQEEQVSLRVSYLIRQLEIKKEELSRKMGDIEELCDMMDPVTVLQGRESDRADYCGGDNEDREVNGMIYDRGDLDVGLVSKTLHSGLAKIWSDMKSRCHVPEELLLGDNVVSDMLMDVNTASNKVIVSDDLKTVYWTNKDQKRPKTSLRFKYPQVLSSRRFSSGRHYWEVEVSEAGSWLIGAAYPSTYRKESNVSWAGNNDKSWSLVKYLGKYSFNHDDEATCNEFSPTCQGFRIFLDYEAGRLSFYELCDPIRHLHTFTATFTEPLHAVFGVGYYHLMSGQPFSKNEVIWMRITH
uniref:Uncharacterized protein n=1 Tax=Leptobrachium leishanense TaxID=445787 RepID=A0A8C5Q1X9_9ANUR